MFGAIYGDVIGSYYEVHCTKDYNFEFKKRSLQSFVVLSALKGKTKGKTSKMDNKKPRNHSVARFSMVDDTGIEPVTSCTSNRRSSQVS